MLGRVRPKRGEAGFPCWRCAVPHFPRASVRLAPHFMQKRPRGGLSCWHPGHCMPEPPASGAGKRHSRGDRVSNLRRSSSPSRDCEVALAIWPPHPFRSAEIITPATQRRVPDGRDALHGKERWTRGMRCVERSLGDLTSYVFNLGWKDPTLVFSMAMRF